MKKVARTLAKKVVSHTPVGTISAKVKEEVDKKVKSYKKKIALLALELGFFVLGFNFLLLGIIELLAKRLSEEYVLIFFGLALILLGLLFSKNLHKQK